MPLPVSLESSLYTLRLGDDIRNKKSGKFTLNLQCKSKIVYFLLFGKSVISAIVSAAFWASCRGKPRAVASLDRRVRIDLE